jgi:hypothetical protein
MIDGLKTRFLDAYEGVVAKITESPQVQQLKEDYDRMNPRTQTLVRYGGVGLAVALIAMVPYSFYSSSTALEQDYDSSVELMREFVSSKRLAAQSRPDLVGLNPGQLQASVNGALMGLSVQPEQKEPIQPWTPEPSAAPKDLLTEAVEVRFKQLNVAQIEDIGRKLSTVANANIVGIEVQAHAGKKDYFDLIVQMIQYRLPEAPKSKAPPPRGDRARAS